MINFWVKLQCSFGDVLAHRNYQNSLGISKGISPKYMIMEIICDLTPDHMPLLLTLGSTGIKKPSNQSLDSKFGLHSWYYGWSDDVNCETGDELQQQAKSWSNKYQQWLNKQPLKWKR